MTGQGSLARREPRPCWLTWQPPLPAKLLLSRLPISRTLRLPWPPALSRWGRMQAALTRVSRAATAAQPQDFVAAMTACVERVVGTVHAECVQQRLSAKGNYISVTGALRLGLQTLQTVDAWLGGPVWQQLLDPPAAAGERNRPCFLQVLPLPGPMPLISAAAPLS